MMQLLMNQPPVFFVVLAFVFWLSIQTIMETIFWILDVLEERRGYRRRR